MSNFFFGVDDLPKDLMMPLKNGELFYEVYRYYILNGLENII